MFYEYALDPAVLRNWKDVRYFLDSFGPCKGRLLAQYPKNWKKRVFEGLSCKPVEKARCEVRLRKLDKRVLVRRRGNYDASKPWLENALEEHDSDAFRAIVSIGEQHEGVVLAADALDDDVPLWKVPTGRLVDRRADAYAEALGLLLRVSKRVILIDPYFRADRDERRRPLAALCRKIDPKETSVEVHWSSTPDGMPGAAFAIDQAKNKLPRVVPTGVAVTLRCWCERPSGPRMHNRYIVTDVGGVQFGDSVVHDETGTKDRVSILDETSWAEIWAQYASDAPGFDADAPPETIIGSAQH